MFLSVGQYDKAEKYHQKALVITAEIGNRRKEASCYGNLGTVFTSLGQYDKGKEYLQKALAITTKIGDKEGEAAALANLGIVLELLVILKLQKYAWRKLYSYPEILEMEEESSKSF